MFHPVSRFYIYTVDLHTYVFMEKYRNMTRNKTRFFYYGFPVWSTSFSIYKGYVHTRLHVLILIHLLAINYVQRAFISASSDGGGWENEMYECTVAELSMAWSPCQRQCQIGESHPRVSGHMTGVNCDLLQFSHHRRRQRHCPCRTGLLANTQFQDFNQHSFFTINEIKLKAPLPTNKT